MSRMPPLGRENGTFSTMLVDYARRVAVAALGLADEPPAPDCGDVVAGSLVSLRRGDTPCGFLGSLVQRPVVEAVAMAARLAATDDPRYEVKHMEGDLRVRLWLTGPLRPISGPEELSPNDGVMVVSGLNRAMYLPGLSFLGRTPNSTSGLLTSACVAADLHPDAWRREEVEILGFAVEELPRRGPA